MIELAEIGRSVGVLLLMLGAIAGLGYLVRRLNLAPQAVRGKGPRRLRVVETLVVDPRTRLVLVAADDKEHLLLVDAKGAATLDTQAAKSILAAEAKG